MTEECDPHLAASITAAFNVLSTLTGHRARTATYVVVEGNIRRVVTLAEFRRALAGCKRLEVVRGEIHGNDVYICAV